jgi:hypothetical protein
MKFNNFNIQKNILPNITWFLSYSDSQSFPIEAQARTPPLHTRERNRQKVEAASQEQWMVPENSW